MVIMQLDIQHPEVKRYLEEMVSQAVARYVRENETRAKELALVERVVRVEEEIKALHQLLYEHMKATDQRFEALQREMVGRFEAMDKRFETLEKANQQRFEAMEKRLSFIQWFMGFGFTFIASFIGIATYLLAR